MNAADAARIAYHMDLEIFAEWTARLAPLAEGLDLGDRHAARDLAARVELDTAGISAGALGSLARALGHRGPLAAGRGAACSAVACAWIARPR